MLGQKNVEQLWKETRWKEPARREEESRQLADSVRDQGFAGLKACGGLGDRVCLHNPATVAKEILAWRGYRTEGWTQRNQGILATVDREIRPCAGLWLLAGDFSMEPHQFFGFVTPQRLPDVFDCSTPCHVPAMLLLPLSVTSIAELGDRGRPRLKQPASPCLGEVETYPTWPCDQNAMDTESAAPADRGPCTQARGTEWIKGGRLV